jgi:hypothetical protein
MSLWGAYARSPVTFYNVLTIQKGKEKWRMDY